MSVMRAAYTEELIVGAPHEVNLEFAEHAVSFRLAAVDVSCTVNGGKYELRGVDGRATITFDSNLCHIDENVVAVDPGAVRELSIDVTAFSSFKVGIIMKDLWDAGFRLTD